MFTQVHQNIESGKKNNMHKPLIKKALSYFKDVLLESTSSEYNEVLSVYLSKGRYQLCTSGAIYSYEDKYINFFEVFKIIDWSKVDVQKVLVLGLGLASIPQILEQNFEKDFEYDAVEIDGEIISLAQKYILDNLKSYMQIIEMDAAVFVEIAQEKYDMIVIDIFENDMVPFQFELPNFLEKTSRLLNDNGILLFNRLNIDESSRRSTITYFEEVFKGIFPQAEPIYIRENIILINRKDIIKDMG